MRNKLMIVLLIALVCASVLFAVIREVGNFLVWRYYLDESEKQERTEKYVEQFQDYVADGKLSINDSAKISKWSAGRYVDIILYKEESLIYAPDWFVGSSPMDTLIPDGGIKESELYKSWFSGERGFERYFTEEAKAKYASALEGALKGNSSVYPIYFADGTGIATVVDYSEDFLYGMVFVVGIICALLLITLIMVFNFNKMALRVNKLAEDVRLVESGDIDGIISIDGNDEIAALASDVNSMRNSVLENMMREREAWETNSALVTAMSHDIRTPLTVIMGYLDLIELQNTDAENAEYISSCRENAMRLKRLSDDMFLYLLVFGKSEMSLNIELMPSDESALHIIAEHSFLLSKSGYTVENDIRVGGEIVRIDTVYFSRVIDNVFSNIIKYADAESPIRIKAESSDGFVRLSFTNKVRTDKNIPESNGIGIKTCIKIMQQMGGKLDIEEKDGDFTVILSVAAESENDNLQHTDGI